MNLKNSCWASQWGHDGGSTQWERKEKQQWHTRHFFFSFSALNPHSHHHHHHHNCVSFQARNEYKGSGCLFIFWEKSMGNSFRPSVYAAQQFLILISKRVSSSATAVIRTLPRIYVTGDIKKKKITNPTLTPEKIKLKVKVSQTGQKYWKRIFHFIANYTECCTKNSPLSISFLEREYL